MIRIKTGMLAVIVMGTFLCNAHATNRYFSDIAADSPSKRYRVEAKSPDNASKTGRPAFQASFVYTCHDTMAKQVLWTRVQAMGKPRRLGVESAETYRLPEEGSPVDIFVSDEGWTVIRTDWDEIIAVDSLGHDRCRIELLKEGFTKEENSEYVYDTSAGPMWSSYSLWYFLSVADKHLFVVRPWWGRRVVLNLETGKLADESPDVSRSAVAYERQYVMTELKKAVETRKEWEMDACCEATLPILNASYLAGCLPVLEAVPFLEQLQEVSYIGRSTTRFFGVGEQFEGEVNPGSYNTFTLRQVVQLSLRRLGKTPRPLPAIQFDIKYEAYEKNHPYFPKVGEVPRATNCAKVRTGMKAEQVLDLLDGPDFVESETWEYDMDANPPFTLILKWDARHVIDVQKRTPALWKKGLLRDVQITR